jgi:plastocyanin
MKKIFGFIILLIVLVAFAGCTQQAAPAPVTTPPTTIPTPVPTTEITPVPTTLPKTVVTTVVTTVLPTATRTESPQTKLLTKIQMKNNAFVPPELVALPGSGITWINDDTTVHSLTMSFSDGGFNTGDILPGSQWSYDFGKREGTYNISCIYHPDMKGTVVVKTTASIIGNPQK